MDRYEGLHEFFKARGQALSRTAFLLTGDVRAAEDLVQEAMTRTIARWGKATATGNPEAYIRKVMLNQVRSRWRFRRRHGAEYATDQMPDQMSNADMESLSIEKAVLASALRTLAPRQRAVLYLRFYEDLSEAEAAEILGCSVGTVKSQTHDALRRLRRSAPNLYAEVHTAEVTE